MDKNQIDWHRYSAAESFERIRQGENPWVALGDFLDDWGRSNHEDRFTLIAQPPKEVTTLEEQRWAALFNISRICRFSSTLTKPTY